MKPQQTAQVEIVLDIACVWSYLGYSRFTRAVSEFRASGGVAEVTFLPFQIDPYASTEGKPLVDVLIRNFGSVEALEKAHSSSFAAEDGVELDINRVIHANTLGAHALIATATEQGLGEQMVTRLFTAYYVDGLNVADPSTLATLAKELGVQFQDPDTDAVRAKVVEVQRGGVQGVPVFIMNGSPAFSGAKSQNEYLAALTTAATH
jgi:predicted DsbA family dithiol-disulfide isomerase